MAQVSILRPVIYLRWRSKLSSTSTTLSAVCATNMRFSPSHFTGKERDTESGNDNYGARYYVSSMGGFLSPDWTEDPSAIPYGDTSNPQSFNLYSYAGNNPVANSDDDGHDCIYNNGDGTRYVLGGDCASDTDSGIYINGRFNLATRFRRCAMKRELRTSDGLAVRRSAGEAPGEFHLGALAEPYVALSRHTALSNEPLRIPASVGIGAGIDGMPMILYASFRRKVSGTRGELANGILD